MRMQRAVALGMVLLLVISGIALLISNVLGVGSGASTTTSTSAASGCRVVSPEVPGARESELSVQPLCALPPEAAAVASAIAKDGPFRYKQDGSTFRNAERRLPARKLGYYREYTVPTPGSDDRGARRLIVGSGGELYYTSDHYESFVVVDAAATGNG